MMNRDYAVCLPVMQNRRGRQIASADTFWIRQISDSQRDCRVVDCSRLRVPREFKKTLLARWKEKQTIKHISG